MKKLNSLAVLLCLSACASVGPQYVAPDVAHDASVPQAFASSGGLAKFDSAWWQAWGGGLLTRLIERALANNPDIAIAQARLSQARAAQGIQEVALAPNANVGAKVTSDKLSKNSENFANFPGRNIQTDFTNHQIGFDASWEIDFWGRQQNLSRAAQARSQALAERVQDVRLLLAAEVARNYIELRTQQQRLALARTMLAKYEMSVRISKAAFKAGEVSEIEVQRQEAARAGFQASLPALEQALRQNLSALSTLTASTVPDLLQETQAAQELPAVLPVPAAGLPSELLQRRPDVRAAEREMAAATADVGVAQADLYPRFTLLGTAGWSSVSASNLTEKASQMWSIGPQISLPLLNRSRLKDYVKGSEAQLAQAQAAYRKAVLAALADTEVALARMANSAQQVQSQREANQQMARSYQLSEKQAKAGDISLAQLLEMEKSYLQQQDALLQSRGQNLVALVALYKSLGGGWQ